MIRPALPLCFAFAALPVAAQPVDDGTGNLDATPAFAEQTEAPEQLSGFAVSTTVITEGLEQPWAVAVLPGGAGYLVTERPGRLRHIGLDGAMSAPLDGVPEVRAQRQGGLLDVVVAPDFADSRVIYLSYSKPVRLGRSVTSVVRAVLAEDHSGLSEVTEIFEQDPPSIAPAHYGSRVEPLPDGTLAITTGDRFMGADLSQDPRTTYGVVARVSPDGSPAPDNPTLPQADALPTVFSYGHRNVQGAAVQPSTAALWTIEHGPAGGDELNLIEPGGNYGWPIVSYGVNYNGTDVGTGENTHAPDFVEPRYFWDPVIAPGGMIFYQGEMFPEWEGDLLISGLVAQSIVRLEIDGDTVRGEERLIQGFDRIRDVAIDADGSILFVTGSSDGVLARVSR